ncbi:methyltransferase domain-containing protein [Nocardiopsis mangrovi]|uniref:Methyltransferase domain-containing protein n=1 Tax=Nocardiopsis mangrovi TaxID=1179818 RepID=A0ABV9E3P8_9ACTN
MVNDTERNDRFRDALRRVVRPGHTVLDIGAGTGLLGMVAADHGATTVVSCEAVPPIADAARRIVAANGHGTAVRVVAKHSTDLRVGVDLPRRADVIVTETVDYGLLGEATLPTVRHARRELLRPGGAMVPCSARLVATLVDSPAVSGLNHVERACGYDVSLFNAFRTPGYFPVWLARHPHRRLTGEHVVAGFDFRRDDLLPGERVSVLPVAAPGTCHGVAFWFELDLTDDVSLTNAPGRTGGHWPQAFFGLPRPAPLAAGEHVRLTAAWTDDDVRFRLSPERRSAEQAAGA